MVSVFSIKMREAVCFVLLYIFVNIVEAVKPKSVNLALETVLQFDKKDQSADVEVLNRVQSFLDNIKHAVTSSKYVRRRSYSNDLKFTDFLLETAEVLNTYDDNDLEDFFAVLDEQSRKYHYKGCKFYELVQNNDVRKYMSNKLEQAKDTSAKTMRRYLKDTVRVLASEDYDKHRDFVNLVNSLYDGLSDKFDDVVNSLRTYQTRSKYSNINLEDIVSNALRTLFFDHYSNLNDNARQHLKKEIDEHWIISGKYNGGNHKIDRYSQVHHGGDDMDNGFKETVQDFKSKLRVIDVPSKFKNGNMHKSDRIKIRGIKGSLPYKKDKRYKSKKPVLKLNVDFFDFKKTTQADPVTTLTTSEEINTKSNKKQYGVTGGLIDEDVPNSYEVKKPKNREKSYKAIKPTKSSDDDSSDGTESTNASGDSRDKKGISDETESTNASGDSTDKKGISIDVSNEKYISKQKKKLAKKKHKKQEIGHITYDVERRIKFKALDYTDENTNNDSETDENTDSNEEVKNPKETVQEDLNADGILIGGQNVHDMNYRAEHTPKASKRKGKDTAAEHSEDSNLQVSTKKLNDRQKSHLKFSKKRRGEKKTTASSTDELITRKASEIKYNKDSAFASSDEGITIETFENVEESENKDSNLRKANKLTTVSLNVHKRIVNLEQQMEDVKERIELVILDKANNTEADAQINAKSRASDRNNFSTEENSQTDAKVDVSNQNDKAFENRVYSGAFNNSETKTTNTITKSDTTTTVEYETKPSTTTMQEKNDETNITINPTFRSHLVIDNRKTQESNENVTVIITTLNDHEVTEAVKEHTTTKTEILNDTTLNARSNLIFKTSVEAVTALGFHDQKSGKENISTKAKVHEEAIFKEDVEKVNVTTTIVDLTKHLKDSDTVVVNVTDKGKNDIMELKESTNEIDDFVLPKTPFFQDDKLDDPFNDLDI